MNTGHVLLDAGSILYFFVSFYLVVSSLKTETHRFLRIVIGFFLFFFYGSLFA